jgi:hypothetical protein
VTTLPASSAPIFGSGDCPTVSSDWRHLEVDAELRAGNYHKPQSPFS